MSSLAFGQTEFHPIEAPSLEFTDLEGKPIPLKSFFAGAKAVVVFFIRVNAVTQAQGHQLASYLNTKYQGEWREIPAKVLIVAHGDSEGIRQVTDGIVLPVLRSTGKVFEEYAVTAYTLYVLCVEGESGRIIARFDKPEDIKPEEGDVKPKKVDLAVKSCVLSDYLIKASFDDGTRTSVFKTPEDTPLAGSDITTRGEITCGFPIKITEQSLENMKSEGVPDDILDKLQSLKDQKFTGEKEFLDLLKGKIGDEQADGFKSLILKHAEITSQKRVGEQGRSIEISFPGRGEGTFGIDLPAGTDLSRAVYLSMWILGQTGREQFHIAIEDRNGVEKQLPVSDYISVLQSRWQRVCIPLTDFGLDLQNASNVSLKFEGNETATIYVDDLMFLYRSAKIFGTVTENGNPVHGATVTTAPETRTVTSDASGRYEIANISSGTYEVIAVKNGRRGSRSVTVEPGRAVTADIQIGTGGPGQDETSDIETETIEIELIIRIKEAPRGNGGSNVRLPINGIVAELRFSVELRYQTDLNEHTISDSLRQEFETNGILLSQQVTISFQDREDGNKEWLITDEENETEYLVAEEEDRLNIYARGLERLSVSEREQYKVVIYSQTDLFYVQPYENDHYTTISANGKWSPPPGIHLAEREKTYMALLVKQTKSRWPSWPSSWSTSRDVSDDKQILNIAPDGVQILDIHQVPPLFRWRDSD